MVVDEITEIVPEIGKADLDGLAPPGGEVVEAGDAGVKFMQSLAHGIACPAQEEGRLPLTEVECLDRLCHEASALGTVEGIRGLHQPRTHRRTQVHFVTSCNWEVGIVQNSSGRFIVLNPPERQAEPLFTFRLLDGRVEAIRSPQLTGVIQATLYKKRLL